MRNEVRESESLEWKSIEILDTNEGRRDVVRICSAICNSGGGTILLGIGQGRRADFLQSLDPKTEFENPLNAIMHDSTKPCLKNFVNFRRDRLEIGATILRIDIKPARGELVLFYTDGARKYVAFHRVGDTTQEMTADQLQRTTRQLVAFNRTMQGTSPSKRAKHAYSWDQVPEVESSFRASGLKRIAPNPHLSRFKPYKFDWATSRRDIVFGDSFPFTLTGQCLYSLSTHPRVRSHEQLEGLLTAAEEHLGLRLNCDFAYSIQQDDQTRSSWTAREMLADFRDLRAQVEDLVTLRGKKQTENWYYAPTVTAYGAVMGGLFWLSLESRDHLKFREAECGLILPDILFNDAAVKDFFKAIGEVPLFYRATSGVQALRIFWDKELQNPQPIRIDREDEDIWRILVDNPFFGHAKKFAQKREWQVPKEIAQDLCAIPRIPVEVRGGYVPSDKHFGGDTIFEILTNYFGPGLFINGMCSAGP